VTGTNPLQVQVDVIDFQEALKRTEDGERTLLIGNGFSSEYFSYRNLLDKSGLERARRYATYLLLSTQLISRLWCGHSRALCRSARIWKCSPRRRS
jgi:hypothetical protein